MKIKEPLRLQITNIIDSAVWAVRDALADDNATDIFFLGVHAEAVIASQKIIEAIEEAT